MFTPEEITDFFDGKFNGLLGVSYAGSDLGVILERLGSKEVVARIPIKGAEGGPFNIEAALTDPLCGVHYSVAGSLYIVQIIERRQIRSVIKIACNHLGWMDEDRLSGRLVPSGRAPNNSFKPKPLRGSA